jgi:outer membrane receptor protein involved in Fe transport
MTRLLLASVAVIAITAPGAVVAAPASAPATPSDTSSPQPSAGDAHSKEIVVTGHRFDIARDTISPALGASKYTFDQQSLQKQPGGANSGLDSVLLQAPGVTQDSYGVVHVRNEHANLQYRLNGVIVPESISGFGTTFDPRIASSIDLITGTLPAQYGFRTAGIVNFKTNQGLLENGGEIGIYGGSFGRIEPSAMVQGSAGNLSYFLSGSYLRDDLGIENPLPTKHAIHDRTTQYRPFAYVSDILSPASRISVFGGSFIGNFQIPDVTGVGGSYTVNGRNSYDASKLDQDQREVTHYAVAAYQYSGDKLNLLVAPFVRYSETRFTPDPNQGDIIFNGFADYAKLSSLAAGVQADSNLQLGTAHTLRFGAFFQNEHTHSLVTSDVLPVDADGNQTTDVPLAITDQASKNGQLYGLYLQDEWTLTPTLTFNFGTRYDVVHAYTHEQQLSPRANLVWKPTGKTTLHVGYARNFTPPPQELIAPASLSLYIGTTKQPQVLLDGPVKAEREHYFDGGIEQIVAPGAKIAIDGYYKIKRDLLDEGQFGSAIVLSPFNYAKGYAWGVELSGSYTHGPLDLYANLARGQEKGKDIVSSQYFFAPDELAYIANHYIFTDHSQKWTASGGASYTFHDGPGTLVPSADFIYGSGLRTDDPNGIIPNGGELPGYFVLNAGLAQNFTGPGPLKGVTLRLDVTNLFDKKYEIRSGSGVGVGAPQWGERRGVFVGVSKKF